MSLPFAIAYRQPGTPPSLEVAPSTVVNSMHKLNPHFTQETLHKNHTFYTDGSKMDNKTGAAVAYRCSSHPQHNVDLLVKFHGLQTAGRGELAALAVCVEFVITHHLPLQECVIITDYQPFTTHIKAFPHLGKPPSLLECTMTSSTTYIHVLEPLHPSRQTYLRGAKVTWTYRGMREQTNSQKKQPPTHPNHPPGPLSTPWTSWSRDNPSHIRC